MSTQKKELNNILPFCKDINNMIIKKATPYRFEVGKIYTEYHDKHFRTPIIVAKINKKSIRLYGNWICCMNIIPIEELIDFKDDKKHDCFSFKIYDKHSSDNAYEKYESRTDYLMYHDNQHVYYGFLFPDSYKSYQYCNNTNSIQKYKKLEDNNKTYPSDIFDTSKYTFLNVPYKLRKYFNVPISDYTPPIHFYVI